MSLSVFCIVLGGVLSIIMALFHIQFHKLFDWKNEFNKLSPANNRIINTIHIALLLFFIIFSLLSFIYLKELAECKGLAFGLNICYSIFWLWRTFWQVFYFKAKKGNYLILHYILIIVFLSLSLCYCIPTIITLC